MEKIGCEPRPPTIIFTDEGVTVKMPALLHHNTEFMPYEAISSVFIHTPIAGFSTITFYAYGREILVHGFFQREVREMKELVEGMTTQLSKPSLRNFRKER